MEYSCEECDFRTHQKSLLILHNKYKHEGMLYRCDICNFKTTYEHNLKTHKLALHCKANFQCPDCNFKATNRRYLTKHYLVTHAEKEFKCEKCEYSTGYKTSLTRHVFRKHDKSSNQSSIKMNTFICEQCDLTLGSSWGMKMHKRQKHLGLFKTCDKCDHTARTSHELNDHIKFKHEGLKISCPYTECNYKAGCRSSISVHTRMKHTQTMEKRLRTKNYKCDDCDYFSHYKKDIKRHHASFHVKMDAENEVSMNIASKDEVDPPQTQISDSSTIYLCPVSACVFTALTITDSLVELHLKTVHPDVNKSKCRFIKL